MRGKLVENGVRLYVHERMTVDYFLARGEDVELIKPSYRVGGKNADILLRGKVWETKSPTTTNKNTLIVMMKRAVRQSPNLIVDLRRIKGSNFSAVRILQMRFLASRQLRNLLIITKNGELIELKK